MQLLVLTPVLYVQVILTQLQVYQLVLAMQEPSNLALALVSAVHALVAPPTRQRIILVSALRQTMFSLPLAVFLILVMV